MKSKSISILLAITATYAMAECADTKHVIDAVSQKATAGDIRGLMAMQPDFENLWKQDSTGYLEAMKLNTHALIAAPDPEARKNALNTFSSILEKTSPTDTVAATAYFELKWKIIGDYFNLVEVRENKDRLMMVASFLGEVRSRRISNYQNGGGIKPAHLILDKEGVDKAADLPTEVLKEAYAKAVKENEEITKMNRLQTILSSVDWGLTSYLQEYAKVFFAKKPENREFYDELAKRAKLTDDEIKTLNTPR